MHRMHYFMWAKPSVHGSYCMLAFMQFLVGLQLEMCVRLNTFAWKLVVYYKRLLATSTHVCILMELP